GGLAPGGAGVRDTQKVRLMHAAVRHLVASSEAWDPDWGVPVNQEDLGGTLMTFSIVVVDSLRKLGVSVTAEEADAYCHAWNCVGHILGIDERLLPGSEDEGRALQERIIGRHWAPCPEGQAMTKALIDTMEHATPGTIFDGFASYIVRYLGGDELGDILGVKRQNWTRLLGGPLRMFARDSDAVVDHDPLVAAIAERFSKQLLEGIGWVARGGERAPFDIPQELADDWGVRTARQAFAG
ncbi:MAG TPA: oxygenase MpaB family protein, partial [Solirubrobacteraceae bacterium]